MGANLSVSAFDNKLCSKRAKPQTLLSQTKPMGTLRHKRVSLNSIKIGPFEDFLVKCYRTGSLLRLTDPHPDIYNIAAYYSLLEKNSHNFKGIKQLAIGRWPTRDELEEAEISTYEDDDEDYIYQELSELSEDDQEELEGEEEVVLYPPKDMFGFLRRYLKEFKQLTKLKIEAFSELKKYLPGLKANIKYLKNIKELGFNICEIHISKSDIQDLVYILKRTNNVEVLSITIQWSSVSSEGILSLLNYIPRLKRLRNLKLNFSSSLGLNQKVFEKLVNFPCLMKNLDSLSMNLKRQALSDVQAKKLCENMMENQRIKHYTVVLEFCPELSFWLKLKLAQQDGFYIFSCPYDHVVFNY